MVFSVTAQEMPEWLLFSFNVSAAFAKGLTFEELSQLTGEPLRRVQVELSEQDVAVVRTVPGFEGFDLSEEMVLMIKAVYGLKDAPRAWRKKLHQILVQFSMRELLADPQLYVMHVAGKLPIILSTHVDDLKG